MSKHPFIEKKNYKAEAKGSRIKKERELHELASKCLGNEEFQRYLDKYMEVRDEMMHAILNFSEEDPVKYAFGVKSLIDRYKSISLLIQNVQSDIKETPNA